MRFLELNKRDKQTPSTGQRGADHHMLKKPTFNLGQCTVRARGGVVFV